MKAGPLDTSLTHVVANANVYKTAIASNPADIENTVFTWGFFPGQILEVLGILLATEREVCAWDSSLGRRGDSWKSCYKNSKNLGRIPNRAQQQQEKNSKNLLRAPARSQQQQKKNSKNLKSRRIPLSPRASGPSPAILKFLEFCPVRSLEKDEVRHQGSRHVSSKFRQH